MFASATAPTAAATDSRQYLREVTTDLELAVIAYTKGQLSDCELWAELDWAATCYSKAAEEAAKVDANSKDVVQFTAWAEGTRARYAELTRP